MMVMLSDASVSGRDSGNNVGYDGCRNVMTNRPAINGKSDTVTDTLSVGRMDTITDAASDGRSERGVHGLTDG
ncbi:hypothetical protein [Marseilla massiliensis]|uniref:hypothetical protein n=1 Tax=Marseilla massiliensis TaxID=1841864 RepID=UPI002013892D|nr:hypothetical protein [Marseilla massiliensis]MCL1610233.1 hypothetical protein [Marseilla massiliensis]